MTDSARLPDPRPAVRGLPRGSGVIVRHYEDPGRAELARDLIALCRPRKIPVLIAGDPRLALSLNADGLHLPEYLVRQAAGKWRCWRRPGMLLSAAAHSPLALTRAARAGADFALLSPVFPTTSHPDSKGVGVLRLAAWASGAGLPVFALGGVNAGNWRRALFAGADGWAGIDGLSDSPGKPRS